MKLFHLIELFTLKCLHKGPCAVDEDWYQNTYQDVAQGIADGHFLNGQHHYLKYGRSEGRTPVWPGELQGPLERKGRNRIAQLTQTYHIDRMCFIPGGGLYLVGWYIEKDVKLLEITCRTKTESFSVPSADVVRCARKDVENLLKETTAASTSHAGFHCFIKAPLHHLDEVKELAFVHQDGSSGTFSPLDVNVHQDLTDFFPNYLLPDSTDPSLLWEKHLTPAYAALSSAAAHTDPQITKAVFGSQKEGCRASVIVPVQHSLSIVRDLSALWGGDESMKAAEIMFVVSCATPRAEQKTVFQNCSRIFNLPYTVLFVEADVTRPHLYNIGAEHASADVLVLHSPEVLSAQQGWLDNAVTFRESRSDIGLCSAVVLYEDGLLKHACASASRDEECLHLSHSGLPPQNLLGQEPLPSDLILGGIVLVGKQLFLDHQGLDAHFHTEDLCLADLSLSMSAAGNRHYVDPEVICYSLPHLNHSGNSPEEFFSRFDRWYFHSKHGEAC